ncbi:MAG: phosphocholine cytidylyltransferase family protein [Kiritimatiellae bacterium]|nr:phosphocholine cytidylyltransferase family protein [Kiritimatiellia bacterium]
MKAVILAAGEGSRLKKYTRGLPKGMLEFAGKSLIKRQVDLFRAAGIDDISIVKGYARDRIRYPGIAYYVNDRWASTNMVVSLFCAEPSLAGDVVVSYADIVFEASVLTRLLDAAGDIVVVVDTMWERYWKMRYGDTTFDTESLRIEGESRVVSLGKPSPDAAEIDARYVGLLKFSAAGVKQLKSVWSRCRDRFWDAPWQISGRPLRTAYMTDMLQALIDDGHSVAAMKIENGWIEFDTNEDYEKAMEWLRTGALKSLCAMAADDHE